MLRGDTFNPTLVEEGKNPPKNKISGKKKGGLSCKHEESILREVCEIAAARGYDIK